MQLPRWFAGGFVMGAAAASAVWLAWGSGLGTQEVGGRGASNRTALEIPSFTEMELREEIAELRATLAQSRNGAEPESPATGGLPDADTPAAKPSAFDRVREQLREVRESEPTTARLLELVAEWRAHAEGSDAEEAAAAAFALLRLARWRMLSPKVVDDLAESFLRLPLGAPGRPGLAATVARAWARDPRLGGWLDGLPPIDEPRTRAAVVEALDESPSDAYRDYLLRISATEGDADVLDEAWHEDPITVALTPQWAPRIIAAIEPRVVQGGLPAEVRGRALYSIGLAGQHEPTLARAAIGRLLARESNEGVRAFGRAVLEAIERGEANVQVLDGQWGLLRRGFRE